MLNIDTLLKKEMTRLEFVKALVFGLVSVVGAASVLGMLQQASTIGNKKLPGYGEQNYGP